MCALLLGWCGLVFRPFIDLFYFILFGVLVGGWVGTIGRDCRDFGGGHTLIVVEIINEENNPQVQTIFYCVNDKMSFFLTLK